MAVNEFEYSHSRQPSSGAVIRDFPHRATLVSSKDPLAPLPPQRHGSYAIRHRKSHRPNSSVDHEGRAPTIVSTIISPTASRRASIKRQKRFMMSHQELKSKYFYPVNGPRRLHSRRGKYRTSVELDASMNYINIDAAMSKDLCVNQYVKSFQVKRSEYIKVDPMLTEQVKSLTVDSKNNIILYTPMPTVAHTSVADAEQILSQELRKLGKLSTDTRTASEPSTRRMRQRMGTFPLAQKASLVRTRSLPARVKDDRLETLWNLYLRRVVADRIRWRLTHMQQDGPRYRSRGSVVSSVETDFFLSHLLTDESAEPRTPNPHVTGNSHDSASSSYSSPRRRAMLDSLEQLMNEVQSVMSTVS